MGGMALKGYGCASRGVSAVVVAGEELAEPFLPEGACVGGRGVALEERERDRAVEVREDHGRAGPEPLQLGAELVAERDALLDEDLATTGQGAERFGLVAVGCECSEAVAVGAGELAQHERVEPVGLPARPEPVKPGETLRVRI
jgi:hypothetical protein